MFSEKKFYEMVYTNLLEPLNIQMTYCNDGTFKSIHDFYTSLADNAIDSPVYQCVLCYDQEPIYLEAMSKFWNPSTFIKYMPTSRETGCVLRHDALTDGYYIRNEQYFSHNFHVLATSEHSQEKQQVLKYLDNTYDWYYFYHGFASLYWFKNIIYRKPIKKYTKLFISFNHLFTEKRNYRLNFISRVREAGLESQCLISLGQTNTKVQIKKDLLNTHSLLTKESKKLIYKNLVLGNTDNLIIDQININGNLSANDSLDTFCQGLFHIVTETIFYDEKLHLTEKIFKPIVAQRPFMLLCAPGNLAYLKSYGFKTFDRWIDESYDSETDPDRRIELVIIEMQRLSKLSQAELDQMYSEMQSVLQHNFYWFYTGFKHQITDELIDNFRRCLINNNAGLSQNSSSYIDYSCLDFDEIKKRLSI
jgi:hypothetical protein